MAHPVMRSKSQLYGTYSIYVFIPHLFAGSLKCYSSYPIADRWAQGLNRREFANTDPNKSSASQNLLPDRIGDPLRRSGEKLSELFMFMD